MTEEKRLLEGIKKRRRGSLEKAIDMYTPYVSVIVYNIIGAAMTREDVEETVSDAFISLWKTAHTLDTRKGTLRAYLGAIARNCALKKLRKAESYSELDENIVSGDGEPSEEFEEKEEREKLLRLINSLGEPDSEIFLRYYWYGETAAQIAAATGVNKSTVTTKLQRGRNKLKEILGKEERQQWTD